MSILEMTPQQLVDVKDFRIEDLPMGRDGNRLAVFSKPMPNHVYVVGGDFAQGMSTGDYDAFSVFDRNTIPWKQVAVAHGRWGPTVSHKILYALLRLYNGAFFIGERQVGLAVMRMLADEYSWTYQFYERDERKLAKPWTDRLGHWTTQNDVTLTDLRIAIRDAVTRPTIAIYDLVTLTEIEKMQWQARGQRQQQAFMSGRNIPSDITLKASAPSGFHDDLVISVALALKGLRVVDAYEADKPKYLPGTYGYLDNPEELLAKQDEENRTHAKSAGANGAIFNPYLHGDGK